MEKNHIYIIKGKYPVLISAPHAHSHKRPTMTGIYKYSEPYTDYLARKIASNLSASAILLENGVDYDPNFHGLDSNEYKAKVSGLINKFKIKRFIDLHGLSDIHPFDVGIWHVPRYKNSKDMAVGISDRLDSGGLRGLLTQIFHFNESAQESLSEFVSKKLKIPSVQIEVARYIREDDTLRDEFVDRVSEYFSDM